MPLVDWDDGATWGLVYRARNRDPENPEHGQTYTYGREWAKHFFDPQGRKACVARYCERAESLQERLTDARVLVVGCAFGFLVEEFLDLGFSEVWGIDSSAWIHLHLLSEARLDTVDQILDLDLLDPLISSLLGSLTGAGTFDWVITEEVLSSYDDTELPGVLDACEALLTPGVDNSQIVHIVNTPRRAASPPFNTKTLEEWQRFRPSHDWVSTQEVDR